MNDSSIGLCTFYRLRASHQAYDLGAKIEEMVVLPGGVIIISTSDGLMGIEAH
ncbi:MAG: hypothetical protein ACP5O2_08195 [Bacteroidales bacterium]